MLFQNVLPSLLGEINLISMAILNSPAAYDYNSSILLKGKRGKCAEYCYYIFS
jgi:hypothetical protein